MKVAVVTPTIGSEHLEKCIQSVDEQSYDNLTHYVFVDGSQYNAKVEQKLEGATRVKKVSLEENVGKGWYGHRVYAACSFLVNADIICYLDEDNWFDPCHVKKMVQKIEEGNDWVYSLRKIYDKQGNFLCEDNCESLGKWPVYFNDEVYHVDTSSFAVKRDCAVRIGQSWYGQWGADRQFFHNLRHHYPKFDCTGAYTLCYRLDGNENSVNKDFFDEGNQIQSQKHPEGFPWNTKKPFSILEPIVIGPGISLV